MKAQYESPVLMVSGSVVRDTLSGTSNGFECENELKFNIKCPGSVGYYL